MGCFLGSWSIESRAYGRAEETSGTQEGRDIYHVIAGRMRKSHLVYKVNLQDMPFSCKSQLDSYDEKTDARGPGKGTKV